MRTHLLAATALSTTVAFLVPGAAVAQTYDWSGFYAGFTLGGGKSLSSIEIDDQGFSIPLPDSIEVPALGPTGGVQAGVNFQSGSFVYGVEGQASWAAIRGNVDEDEYDAATALESLLSLRARLGVAFDRMMIYSTAGIAAGHTNFSVDPGKGTSAAASGIVRGGVVGLGAEYAVNDNASLRVEGKYYHLSPMTADGTVGDSGKGSSPFSATHQPRGVVFEAGLNVHF